MAKIYLIFYASRKLQFKAVETNPSSRHPVTAVCRILCSDVRDLAGNLSELTVASSRYDILLCCEPTIKLSMEQRWL